MGEVLLIAGYKNPVVADHAAYCVRRGRDVVVIGTPDVCDKVRAPAEAYPIEDIASAGGRPFAGLVVYLNRRLTAGERTFLETVAAAARANPPACVAVVSSFRVHCGDRDAARAEAFLLEKLQGLPARVVVVRPSHIVSRRSPLGVFLRRAWFWSAFLPDRFQGCCVDGDELFTMIDRELADPAGRNGRAYTLLGVNKPWRDRLREQRQGRLGAGYAALMGVVFLLALLRWFAGLFFNLFVRRSRSLGAWHVETLTPRSMKELLSIYNTHNYRHVKVVGYNNGVVHFGQCHTGKTVVSTVGCNRLARARGDVAEFDAGVTVRQAMDVLGPAGKELQVLPNYSYVSLGTAFFIPIHGSASACSTIGETIEKVVLYDPVQDRFVAAKRQDPAFGHYLYNLGAEVLLLRVYLRVKERSRYFVRTQESTNLSSQELLGYLRDEQAANVEIRKAGSAAEAVKVSRYYTETANGEAALEVPRDALGRLWDRLEENPVTSVLFHTLHRWLGYHVELFLSDQDFATFWETHRSMPILKIQLRYIRRDGFPNSPFREHDCVSADLVLFKKHKARFEAYLKETLPGAKLNPGKHSM